MQVRKKTSSRIFDVVVVGGGMTGVCAAIASARGGAKTALVQDRPVLGGNASSEIRMHICGASANRCKKNAEETGILHEILLENKYCNDFYNYSIWDNVLFQKIKSEKNIELFLNTSMQSVDTMGDKIVSIECYQLTTETHLVLSADIFIDCSGNGSLAYFAGAEYRTGCESKTEYNEPDAPEEANENRMGNTLLFKAVDRGEPIEFKRSDWGRHFSEEDLKNRKHGDVSKIMSSQYSGENASFACFGLDYGYWWIEVPAVSEDYVDDYEKIRDELVECVYGIWDHLKNGGVHGADNYDLEWVGMLPGTRESRRFVGHYTLTENDILSNAVFHDAVAYGGWPIDNHAPKGIDDVDSEPSFVRHFDGLYTIPYRCYCNRDFANLFQAGKIISATKLGMASARVMGTCSVGGQAVGTAAAICITEKKLPVQLTESITELQQQLLKDDCYIPGIANADPDDLARKARVAATSFIQGSEPENIITGISRSTENQSNCWESDGISNTGEKLILSFDNPVNAGQIRLVFDSNLNIPLKITLSAKRMAEQRRGVPPELIKDYRIDVYRAGEKIYEQMVSNNYQRLNVVNFAKSLECDQIEITLLSTNGYKNAKVFEVRVYDIQ